MHRTNIELDEKLVKEGMRRFAVKTKKDLVNFALKELLRKEKIKGILKWEGKVTWEGNLNKMRGKRVENTD